MREQFGVLIQISLKFVPKGLINIKATLVEMSNFRVSAPATVQYDKFENDIFRITATPLRANELTISPWNIQEDPRRMRPRANTLTNDLPVVNELARPSSNEDLTRNLGQLPAGWEERIHTDGRIFYIDHSMLGALGCQDEFILGSVKYVCILCHFSGYLLGPDSI